jgi:hypothetical protein
MKRKFIACAAVCLLGPAIWAGVVLEMEVEAIDEPERTGSETFYAQGETTRTDSLTAAGKNMSVIFREQTMYFVDHAKKVCQTIDKKGVDQLSEQLDVMMKQMDSLPPEQRAMMEKMMKGKVPGTQEPPTWRVETGGTDQVGEYSCTVYTFYGDEDKVREVCSADESAVGDLAEAMDAIHALSRFAEGLMKVAQNLPFADLMDATFKEIPEIEGFPIRTRLFDGDGKVTLVRTLKSITRRDIEADLFTIPKGYKIKSLEKELKKAR